jgi:hypothetical protein
LPKFAVLRQQAQWFPLSFAEFPAQSRFAQSLLAPSQVPTLLPHKRRGSKYSRGLALTEV